MTDSFPRDAPPDEVGRDNGNPTRLDRLAVIVVLTLLGVTWPVLELLGENAEFFVAKRSSPTEIVLLAVFMTLAIPLLVGVAGSLPGRPGTLLGVGLTAITSTSFAFIYLGRLAIPWWGALGAASLIGVFTTAAVFRHIAVRQAARYLLAAPLIVLMVFLFFLPVGALLGEPAAAAGPVEIENATPIVLIVFDEFPLASIIDSSGRLREDRFPNFARLASDGIWFRNAVTVEQQTEHSVPAILTGAVPEQSLIPVAGQYPFNLFTSLSGVYDLHVHESITQLCPAAICEGATSPATSLLRDIAVVGGHVLLPEPLSSRLPEIDHSWGDFQTVTQDFDARAEFTRLLTAGRRAPIDTMLGEIEDVGGERPPLFYLHALIPHHPWEYLPDGRSYPFITALNPASLDGGWIDDEFLVAQAMQRHLLQVGYADHALGELIDSLQRAGMYEDALVIVVADHGISIRPGVANQRIITPSTVGEIAAIPLFVKPPHAGGGVIDDRRALTIDIFPTIADVIDAELPGQIEGVSLLGPDPGRAETTTRGPTGSVTFGADGDEKLEVAARIEELFPDGDPWALRPEGSPDLVGTTVDTTDLAASDMTTVLSEPQLYRDVSSSDDSIPARIGGSLNGDVDGTEILAVVVNGVVAAVTRSYLFEGETRYLAMVPPGSFSEGANAVELLEVMPDGELRLVPPPGD